MTIEEFADSLAKDLTQGEREILEVASDHPFSCRCQTCFQWWILCHLEEDGEYGPFTKEEIKAGTFQEDFQEEEEDDDYV